MMLIEGQGYVVKYRDKVERKGEKLKVYRGCGEVGKSMHSCTESGREDRQKENIAMCVAREREREEGRGNLQKPAIAVPWH